MYIKTEYYKICIKYYKICIKYCLRILNLPDNRLVRKCSTMLKYYNELGYVYWASNVTNILQYCGFSYVYWASNVTNIYNTVASAMCLINLINIILFMSEFTKRTNEQLLHGKGLNSCIITIRVA